MVISNANIDFMEVNIEPSWKAALQDEFDKPYFSILTSYVRKGISRGLLPSSQTDFQCLQSCPLSKVKVVLIGQDPIMSQVKPRACASQ